MAVSVARVCLLIAALAGIALGVVYLRAEQTRCGTRLVRLESQWVELRRQWWGLQTRAARLRAPERIVGRATFLQTDLVPPEDGESPQLAARLASGQLQE